MEDKGKGREGDEQFTIKVKTRDSQVRDVTVHRDWTIPRLKEELEKTTQVPPSQMRLIYCGKVLKDDPDVTVGSYGIKTDQTVHLVAKSPNQDGAGPSPAAGASSAGQFQNSATYSFGPGGQVSVTQFTTEMDPGSALLQTVLGGINGLGAGGENPQQPVTFTAGPGPQSQGVRVVGGSQPGPVPQAPTFAPFAAPTGLNGGAFYGPSYTVMPQHNMPVISSINLNITATVAELDGLPARLERLMQSVPISQTGMINARPQVQGRFGPQPTVQMAWGGRVTPMPAQQQAAQQQQRAPAPQGVQPQPQPQPQQAGQGQGLDGVFDEMGGLGGIVRNLLGMAGGLAQQQQGVPQQAAQQAPAAAAGAPAVPAAFVPFVNQVASNAQLNLADVAQQLMTNFGGLEGAAGAPGEEEDVLSKFVTCVMEHLSVTDLGSFMSGDWSPLDRSEEALRVVMLGEIEAIKTEIGEEKAEGGSLIAKPVTPPPGDRSISNRAIDMWVDRTSENLVRLLTTHQAVKQDLDRRVKPGADVKSSVATLCRVNLRRLVHILLNEPARLPTVSFSTLLRQNIVKFVGQWAHTMSDLLGRGMADVREHFAVLWASTLETLTRNVPDFAPLAAITQGVVLSFVDSSHEEYLNDLLRSTAEVAAASSSSSPLRTGSPEPRPLTRIPSMTVTTPENRDRTVVAPQDPTNPF